MSTAATESHTERLCCDCGGPVQPKVKAFAALVDDLLNDESRKVVERMLGLSDTQIVLRLAADMLELCTQLTND